MHMEQHAVNNFNLQFGKTPTETKTWLRDQCQYKWHRCFSEGIFDFMDPERSEMSKLYKESTESHIHDLITRDRCLRIREVRSMCGICISKFSVFIILTEDFDMCWICARWLPRILSDYHKKDKCRQVKIYPRMIYAKFNWNWPAGSGEDFFHYKHM